MASCGAGEASVVNLTWKLSQFYFLCFVSGWRRPARGVGRRPAAGAGRIKQTGSQDVAGEYIFIYNISDRIFFIIFRKAVAVPTSLKSLRLRDLLTFGYLSLPLVTFPGLASSYWA